MTSPDPTASAQEAYSFWLPHVRLPIHAFAILGDIAGECAFRANVTGDHGTAFGICQWHATREALILKATGIDVKIASFGDQLKAMLWEVSDPKSSYGHILKALDGTTTLWSAVTVLVARYEQSASQASDVAKRTAYAQAWQAKLGGAK